MDSDHTYDFGRKKVDYSGHIVDTVEAPKKCFSIYFEFHHKISGRMIGRGVLCPNRQQTGATQPVWEIFVEPMEAATGR